MDGLHQIIPTLNAVDIYRSRWCAEWVLVAAELGTIQDARESVAVQLQKPGSMLALAVLAVLNAETC